MNKKGFASSTIIFSLLSVFLIAISILLVTMTNTNKTKSALNEKVVSNIEYGNSSINDIEQRLKELENNTLKIDDIYPVGSIYMSTEDDTIEKVQKRFGGTWEKYSEGRTLIGEGTGTDSNGLVKTFTSSSAGGEYSHKLTINEMPSHTHTFSATTSADGAHTHLALHLKDLDGKNLGWSGIVGSYSTANVGSVGNHTHNVSGTTAASGSGTSFSIQTPYIVTYMYKRIK